MTEICQLPKYVRKLLDLILNRIQPYKKVRTTSWPNLPRRKDPPASTCAVGIFLLATSLPCARLMTDDARRLGPSVAQFKSWLCLSVNTLFVLDFSKNLISCVILRSYSYTLFALFALSPGLLWRRPMVIAYFL